MTQGFLNGFDFDELKRRTEEREKRQARALEEQFENDMKHPTYECIDCGISMLRSQVGYFYGKEKKPLCLRCFHEATD